MCDSSSSSDLLCLRSSSVESAPPLAAAHSHAHANTLTNNTQQHIDTQQQDKLHVTPRKDHVSHLPPLTITSKCYAPIESVCSPPCDPECVVAPRSLPDVLSAPAPSHLAPLVTSPATPITPIQNNILHSSSPSTSNTLIDSSHSPVVPSSPLPESAPGSPHTSSLSPPSVPSVQKRASIGMKSTKAADLLFGGAKHQTFESNRKILDKLGVSRSELSKFKSVSPKAINTLGTGTPSPRTPNSPELPHRRNSINSSIKHTSDTPQTATTPTNSSPRAKTPSKISDLDTQPPSFSLAHSLFQPIISAPNTKAQDLLFGKSAASGKVHVAGVEHSAKVLDKLGISAKEAEKFSNNLVQSKAFVKLGGDVTVTHVSEEEIAARRARHAAETAAAEAASAKAAQEENERKLRELREEQEKRDSQFHAVKKQQSTKVQDMIFGSNKSSDKKILDKLGVKEKELENFQNTPKPYLQLGIFQGATSSQDSQRSERKNRDFLEKQQSIIEAVVKQEEESKRAALEAAQTAPLPEHHPGAKGIDVLHGGNKSSNKVNDRLGITPRERELFSGNMKLYKALGVGDHGANSNRSQHSNSNPSARSLINSASTPLLKPGSTHSSLASTSAARGAIPPQRVAPLRPLVNRPLPSTTLKSLNSRPPLSSLARHASVATKPTTAATSPTNKSKAPRSLGNSSSTPSLKPTSKLSSLKNAIAVVRSHHTNPKNNLYSVVKAAQANQHMKSVSLSRSLQMITSDAQPSDPRAGNNVNNVNNVTPTKINGTDSSVQLQSPSIAAAPADTSSRVPASTSGDKNVLSLFGTSVQFSNKPATPSTSSRPGMGSPPSTSHSRKLNRQASTSSLSPASPSSKSSNKPARATLSKHNSATEQKESGSRKSNRQSLNSEDDNPLDRALEKRLSTDSIPAPVSLMPDLTSLLDSSASPSTAEQPALNNNQNVASAAPGVPAAQTIPSLPSASVSTHTPSTAPPSSSSSTSPSPSPSPEPSTTSVLDASVDSTRPEGVDVDKPALRHSWTAESTSSTNNLTSSLINAPSTASVVSSSSIPSLPSSSDSHPDQVSSIISSPPAHTHARQESIVVDDIADMDEPKQANANSTSISSQLQVKLIDQKVSHI